MASVVQEISHMLQQQAAHLSIKRAASGISALEAAAAAGQGGHKRHSGGPSTLGFTGGGSLLGSGDGGQQVRDQTGGGGRGTQQV
jgi:hypothetical protein